MLPHDETRRIRSLASMARVVGSSRPLLEMLELAAEEALGALDAASVSVSELEPGGLVVRTLLNVGDLGPGEERWPERETYDMPQLDAARRDGDRLVCWTSDVTDPGINPVERDLLVSLRKGHSVSAAMVVDGALWGEFWATRRTGEPAFDDDDIAYLEALLAILSGVVSRSTRESSLAELAFRDPLTGLANRRALDEAAAAAYDVPPGECRHVVVVAVDVDDLKLVNDTAGHDAGDRLIRAAASALLAAFARFEGCVVARVGGDEFTVLVTGRPLGEVVEVADSVAGPTAGPTGFSLSCGVAAVRLEAGSTRPGAATDLFAAADRALYAAKRSRSEVTVVDGDRADLPADHAVDRAAGQPV